MSNRVVGLRLACVLAAGTGVLVGCGKGESPADGTSDARPAAGARAPERQARKPKRDCPPTLSAGAARQGGPVDDIVGLRPGMTYDDVVAVLECRDDITAFQTAEMWSIRQNFGFPTRQLLRASNGVPCTEADRTPRAGGTRVECDTGGNRFEPLKNISEEFIVLFTGMPGEEIARAVWRRSVFPEDGYPANASLVEALTQKYGAPLIQESEMNYYNTAPRPGAALNLSWPYDRGGKMFSRDQAVTFNRDCANGMKPWFGASHTWNSGCGLTIRAELMPVEGSRLMARSMDVLVVDQAALFNSSREFEAQLAAAYEEKARKDGGSAPDL